MASGVQGTAKRLGSAVGDLGMNAAKAFRITGEALKGSGGSAGKMLATPVVWAVKVARWPVAIVSKAFVAAPVPVALATVGAAIYAIGAVVRGQAEKRTQVAAMNEVMAAQQQAAMVPPSPAYGLQPGEFEAQVAPRLRGGAEAASTGHAAAITAARAQAPTPETAAAL